jgi:hypothetical protein
MSTNGGPPANSAAGQKVTGWHFLIVLTVLGSLVLIVWIAINRYSVAADAAAVLGTIIPAIAAIGAAAFGIPLAYQSGKSGKDDAVQKARSDGTKAAVRRISDKLPQQSQLASMGAGSAPLIAVQEELDKLLLET